MIFTGTFENKIDSKGRVSVPAAFRALIQASSSRELAIFPSFRFPCLEAMSFDILTAIAQQSGVSQTSLFTKAKPNPFSLLFRMTHRLHIDDAGRVTLPENLVDHAGLTTTAVFTGEGYSFLLWSPKAHRDQLEEDTANLRTELAEGTLIVDFAAAATQVMP